MSAIYLRGTRRDRRGAIVVLSALMIVAVLAFVAFAVDVGYLLVARSEMQRSADASAIAAVSQLTEEGSFLSTSRRVRSTAVAYAASNPVLSTTPVLRRNAFNLPEGDIVIGQIQRFDTASPPLLLTNPAAYNAVRVRIRRTDQENGEVPLHFARALGIRSRPVDVTATAAIVKWVGGFRPPESGEPLPILPIALHIDDWNDVLKGEDVDDDWAYNESDGSVTADSDGIPEAFLFPKANDSPGNLGTVDIGPASNATSRLRKQIQNGVTEADLAHHGGELKFDDQGKLYLGGDPGLSAGIESALRSIVGQKRMIPIYSEVSGGGNTAVYEIVRFAGVRLMEVNLKSGTKGIYVQPAKVFTAGTIPHHTDGTSDMIYSHATLVD